MTFEILTAILSSIPATILAFAALITSVKHGLKLAGDSETVALAASEVVKAAAIAANAATVACAIAAAKVAEVAETKARVQREE